MDSTGNTGRNEGIEGALPSQGCIAEQIAKMLRRAASSAWQRSSAARSFSSALPSTATPPANSARGATADLCDVFVPDPVDQVTQAEVQIAQPMFR